MMVFLYLALLVFTFWSGYKFGRRVERWDQNNGIKHK